MDIGIHTSFAMSRQRGDTQYNETKTASLYAGLTGTGLKALDANISRYDPKISRSEFLERLGRGSLDPERFMMVFFPSHNA